MAPQHGTRDPRPAAPAPAAATHGGDALGDSSTSAAEHPPPPSADGGAPTVVTFCLQACSPAAAELQRPLQLCLLSAAGELQPIARLVPGEEPHVEPEGRIGQTFVLLPLTAGVSSVAEAVGWYRPVTQLQGARHAVVLTQEEDGWQLDVGASRDWTQEEPNPEYRVILRPTSCGPDADGKRQPGAPLPPPERDWTLTCDDAHSAQPSPRLFWSIHRAASVRITNVRLCGNRYRYDTPPYPTHGWIPTEHVRIGTPTLVTFFLHRRPVAKSHLT